MNTNTQQPHTVREGGKTITLVPLTRSPDPVRLFAEDFEAIRAAGYCGRWFLDTNGQGTSYVRARRNDPTSNAHNIAVARLIMKPEPGEKVCYLDGNRLNLRRDNLTLERGGRRAKADMRGRREESMEKFIERISHRP